MDAGVTFGDGGYTAGPGRDRSPFDYTDIVIGPDGNPVLQPDPHSQDGRTGAGADAQRVRRPPRRARRRSTRRFAAPVSPAAPSINRLVGLARSTSGGPQPTPADDLGRGARRRSAEPAGVVVLVPRSESWPDDRRRSRLPAVGAPRRGRRRCSIPTPSAPTSPGVPPRQRHADDQRRPRVSVPITVMGPGHVTGLDAGRSSAPTRRPGRGRSSRTTSR